MRALLGIPSWLPAVIVLLVTTGLQWFPATGIYLMFLLAPAWSIVLVNAILLLMALDVWLGRAPRWLIIIPVIAYGGNLAASAFGYGELLLLDRELSRVNRAGSLPFDPARMSLVAADDSMAQNLVRQYRIDVTYAPNPRHTPLNHLSYRLVTKEQCALITNNGKRGVHKLGVHFEHRLVANVCQLRMPEDPTRPPIEMVSTTTERKGVFLSTKLTTIRFVAPDGRSGEVTTGLGYIYFPLPRPVIGCALNSGAAKWQCGAGLLPARLRVAAEGDPYGAPGGALARALHLAPRTYTEVKGQYVAEPSELVDAGGSVGRARRGIYTDRDHAYAVLDRVIADPRRPIERDVEELLLADEDRLNRYGWLMVEGLQRAIAAGKQGRDAVKFLGDMIAALPPDIFAPIGPDVVDVLKMHPTLETPILHVRLGELGPSAAPVLLAAFDRSPANAPAAFGLCRLGPPAPAGARDRLVRALALDRKALRPIGETRAAATLALLRLGFRDDVEADLVARRTPLPPNHVRIWGRAPDPAEEAWFDERVAEVDPSSPPSVCAPRGDWLATPAAERLFGG